MQNAPAPFAPLQWPAPPRPLPPPLLQHSPPPARAQRFAKDWRLRGFKAGGTGFISRQSDAGLTVLLPRLALPRSFTGG